MVLHFMGDGRQAGPEATDNKTGSGTAGAQLTSPSQRFNRINQHIMMALGVQHIAETYYRKSVLRLCYYIGRLSVIFQLMGMNNRGKRVLRLRTLSI